MVLNSNKLATPVKRPDNIMSPDAINALTAPAVSENIEIRLAK